MVAVLVIDAGKSTILSAGVDVVKGDDTAGEGWNNKSGPT